MALSLGTHQAGSHEFCPFARPEDCPFHKRADMQHGSAGIHIVTQQQQQQRKASEAKGAAAAAGEAAASREDYWKGVVRSLHMDLHGLQEELARERQRAEHAEQAVERERALRDELERQLSADQAELRAGHGRRQQADRADIEHLKALLSKEKAEWELAKELVDKERQHLHEAKAAAAIERDLYEAERAKLGRGSPGKSPTADGDKRRAELERRQAELDEQAKVQRAQLAEIERMELQARVAADEWAAAKATLMAQQKECEGTLEALKAKARALEEATTAADKARLEHERALRQSAGQKASDGSVAEARQKWEATKAQQEQELHLAREQLRKEFAELRAAKAEVAKAREARELDDVQRAQAELDRERRECAEAQAAVAKEKAELEAAVRRMQQEKQELDAARAVMDKERREWEAAEKAREHREREYEKAAADASRERREYEDAVAHNAGAEEIEKQRREWVAAQDRATKERSELEAAKAAAAKELADLEGAKQRVDKEAREFEAAKQATEQEQRELERARSELERSQKDLERAIAAMEKERAEFERAKAEAQRELAEAKRAREQPERRDYGDGPSAQRLEAELTEAIAARATIDRERRELEAAQSEVQELRSRFEKGQAELAAAQAKLAEERRELELVRSVQQEMFEVERVKKDMERDRELRQKWEALEAERERTSKAEVAYAQQVREQCMELRAQVEAERDFVHRERMEVQQLKAQLLAELNAARRASEGLGPRHSTSRSVQQSFSSPLPELDTQSGAMYGRPPSAPPAAFARLPYEPSVRPQSAASLPPLTNSMLFDASSSPQRPTITDWNAFRGVVIPLGQLVSLKLAFQRADVDKTGRLDAYKLGRWAQAVGVEGINIAQLRAMISEVDTNNSGSVEFWEFFGVQLYLRLRLRQQRFHPTEWMQFISQTWHPKHPAVAMPFLNPAPAPLSAPAGSRAASPFAGAPHSQSLVLPRFLQDERHSSQSLRSAP